MRLTSSASLQWMARRRRRVGSILGLRLAEDCRLRIGNRWILTCQYIGTESGNGHGVVVVWDVTGLCQASATTDGGVQPGCWVDVLRLPFRPPKSQPHALGPSHLPKRCF